MKRFLSILMVVAMLCSLLTTAFAADTVVEYAVEGGNVRFDLATGTIIGADKSVTVAHIPETIEGVTVQAIGAYAFADLEGLGTSLREITLPDTIASIGYNAFYFCTNLEAIDLPDAIETLDYLTFFYCTSLKSVDLPENLKKLGRSAFESCEALESIQLPEGLEMIEDGVFNDCKSLTEINIPNSAQSVNGTFLNNSAYYMDERNWNGSCLVLGDWLVKVDDREYYRLDIPAGVKHIADSAAYGLKHVKEIHLPEGLLTIGDRAFNTTYVEELVIPASVTYIGADALCGFNGLWLYFEGDAPEVEEGFLNEAYYGDFIFRTEESMGWDAPIWDGYDVRVWDGVKPMPREIEHWVAGGLIHFTPLDNCVDWPFYDVIDVKIPEQIGGYPVKKIAEGAFSFSHELVSVEIPATVEEIGADAFRGASSLEYAVFYGDPPAAFGQRDGVNDYNCVFWPDEDFVIYFADGTNWTTPEWHGYRTIPLSQAEHLHDFKLVSGEIICDDDLIGGGELVYACSCGVEKNVTQLETGHNYVDGVCVSCGEMPKGESGELTWTFSESTGTLTFYGNGAMDDASIRNGECEVPWGKYRTRIENIVFDGEITHIGDGAFYKMPAIKNVDLPESLTSIGESAFAYCVNLEEVNFAEGLETIGKGAFSYCRKLTAVNLPNSLTELPEKIFAYCTRLREADLSDHLTKIGTTAFDNCISLENLTLPESLTQIGGSAFRKCEALKTIHVPSAVKILGSGAFIDCTALTSVVIEGEIEILDDYMFSGCKRLTNVILPNSIIAIGWDTFRSCHAVQQITLPENLQQIARDAFAYCIGLTSIEIPAAVTEIQTGAFANCRSLADVYFFGDAPNLGDNAFKLWDNPTGAYVLHPDLMLYYFEGAEGWSSPEWNGYPTAIWGKTEEPSQEPSEPSQEPSEPSQEPSEPSEEPSEPSEEPSEPIAPDEPEIPTENPFADVKDSDYFAQPVLWAVGRGITTGMSATSFAPNDDCTRGQIVTFLWRACGSPEPTETDNPFKDVAEDAYYYNAVLWAVEKGITTGLSATTFGPDATCTRGQVATFLWRSQGEPAPENKDLPFSDVRAEDYYCDAVLWAVENGVTQGVGEGKFAPNASCTRGQIVTFLYRAIA